MCSNYIINDSNVICVSHFTFLSEGRISMGEMNGGSGILMLRKKMEEWGLDPYCSQMFNKDEPYDWRPRYYLGDDYLKESLREFLDEVEEYKSFDFSIGTDLVGAVKLCSYSELQQITDFRYESLIGKTLSGRFIPWNDWSRI